MRVHEARYEARYELNRKDKRRMDHIAGLKVSSGGEMVSVPA